MNELLTLTTLAAEINLLHDAAEQAASSAVQYAARCGAKLNEAKAQVAHGQWLPWLGANCKVSRIQASRYQKLAQEMPELIDGSNVSCKKHLGSINSAIAYLSAPDEVKEMVEQSLEPVTEKQIKTWEKEYRTAQIALDGYQEENQYLKQRVDQLVLNFKSTAEELKHKAIEEVGKEHDERLRMIEQEKKRIEYARQLEQEEFNRKAQELREDKLYAERQLNELKEQQKKAIAAGVESEISKHDETLKVKERQIFSAEQRLKEKTAELEAQMTKLSAVKRRNDSLGNIKQAIATIQIELYDAVDDHYTLNEVEREAWSIVAQHLADGSAILQKWLG